MFKDKNRLAQEIMRASGGKIDSTSAQGAANGDISALMAGLSEQDRQRLNALLADEKATRQLLSSDAAKSLMKILLGGK